MSELTREEFAAICGVTRNAINTYVGRRKINVLEDGKIDTEDVLNKIFIKARKQKAQEKKIKAVPSNAAKNQPTTSSQKKPTRRKTKAEREEEEQNSNLTLRKLKSDTEKAERENEIKKLTLEKMMGQLMPVDLMHGIFKINIQNVFKSFENELVNLASIYCDIMAGGDRSKLSEVIDSMRTNLHRIIKETKANSKKEIEGVINEYAETRSRGERK